MVCIAKKQVLSVGSNVIMVCSISEYFVQKVESPRGLKQNMSNSVKCTEL